MKNAGIEPVAYTALATSRYPQDIYRLVWNDGRTKPVPGLNLYTEQQMREVLIKFANSENAMRRDMSVEDIVDGFMYGD